MKLNRSNSVLKRLFIVSFVLDEYGFNKKDGRRERAAAAAAEVGGGRRRRKAVGYGEKSAGCGISEQWDAAGRSMRVISTDEYIVMSLLDRN